MDDTPTEAVSIDELTQRLIPHLKEIRRMLLTVLIVFFLAALIGFIFYQDILTFIMGLFNLEGVTVVLTSPYQFIDLAVNTALLFGILAAFPLFIYYLLTFIKPALQPREFKILLKLLPLSLILLVAGFLFGIWVMNFVIDLFYQTSLKFNLGNLWDISHFFSQVLITAISLGIVFQFPILLTGLIRFDIISLQDLAHSRRYIYVACLIFAALLPPTDLLSLSLLTIPLILLFEATLLYNRPSQTLNPTKGGEA